MILFVLLFLRNGFVILRHQQLCLYDTVFVCTSIGRLVFLTMLMLLLIEVESDLGWAVPDLNHLRILRLQADEAWLEV